LSFPPRYYKDLDIIEVNDQIKLNHIRIPIFSKILTFSIKVSLHDKDCGILEKVAIWETIVKSAATGIPLELSFAYKSEYAFINIRLQLRPQINGKLSNEQPK
jgi:hypothetical protein